MASILDAGLMGLFSGIFVFLLVYAVVWGVLSWRKPFGKENTGVYAIIAVTVAFLMSVAPPARNFITFVAPWYVALFLVLFFILFVVSIFGLSSETDFPKIINTPRVYVWIIILSILIAAAGFAFTLGQDALELQPGYQAPVVPPGTDVIGGEYYPPGTIVDQPYPGYAPTSPYPSAGMPGSTATSSFNTNMLNTILHPKVLGMLIVLVIASISIYFLSEASSPAK
jgi:hypothetical protein